MFVLGWFVVLGVSHPWWPLTVVAALQAVSGITAAVLAVRSRNRMQPSLGLVRGLIFGVLGLVGVWLFWSIAAEGGLNFGGFGAWGRPLRVRGREVHPRIRVGDEWAAGVAPDVSALDAVTRRVLADWWLLDAQKEHASVPAFARLAWQLTALGAPAELLERAYDAGRQEISHARRCFALVSAYRGQPCGVMPMPELHADDVATDFVRLATESVVDGCFIEELNSDAAELAVQRAKDPAVRDLVATIVSDERAHAELAWDIVAWCAREGGADVERAVAAAVAAIPSEGSGLYSDELAALVARCELADLHAHGRVPLGDWPGLYRERLVATRARVAEMFAMRLAA